MSDDEQYQSPPEYITASVPEISKRELSHSLAMAVNKHRTRVMNKKGIRGRRRKKKDPLKYPKFY